MFSKFTKFNKKMQHRSKFISKVKIKGFIHVPKKKQVNPKNIFYNFIYNFILVFKKGFESFCSSCGGLDVNYDFFECQCTRRFHKCCLDRRYVSLNLYNYNSFHCFFCRENSKGKKYCFN